jgi:hypothetical protein
MQNNRNQPDTRSMKAIRYITIVMAAVLLAACGGSSSGSFDRGGSARMSITPDATEVATGSSVQVNVQFRTADGSPVNDGTEITLTSSNGNRGVVSPVGQPDQSAGDSATAATTGGQANFWFTAQSRTGPVTLTASGPSPSGTGSTSTSISIDVIDDPSAQPRLEIIGSQTMPANNQGVEIFYGSPFINELTIRYRQADGTAGSVTDGEIGVAVSPVFRGAYSTLDDPDTDDVNEFFVLMGSGPVGMTAGVATVFVHSFDRPGPLTVSVTAQDATTGDVFSKDFVIEIEEGAADFLPAQVEFSVPPSPVYTQGSGGTTSKSMSVFVTDSGGNAVPNPEGSGVEYNNVRLQLDAPAGSGARLTGTGATGTVSGTDINVRTVNGVANFALNAGSRTGSHRIIATVDRADNNVDNEVLDPLTAETTVQVGDGQLFSLEMVTPSVNSLLVNRTTSNIGTLLEPVIDPETGILIPPDPDGTYSLTMTVQGVDQTGNPALSGTVVNFGKIDAPLTQSNPSYFVFSGPDGNPEEGGTLFSVLDPGPGFLDNPAAVDDTVEVGDTVALFGKSVPGNREHEVVRQVSGVVDNSTLTVYEPFNPNDQSGSIVDDGFAIPWVVGRAQMGSIDNSVVLGPQGRGTVQLTYPIHAIGRPAVVWTQGNRAESGTTKTVADVNSIRFPGVRPLQIAVTPSAVQGNRVTNMRICLTDGLGAPVNQAFVSGGVIGGPANGRLDGANMPTTTAEATGSDGAGCLVTAMDISGMSPGGDESVVRFSVGEAFADVQVVPPGSAFMTVTPSLYNDPSPNLVSVGVVLRLFNQDGQPVRGVELTGQCDGGDGQLAIQTQPGLTRDDGTANATVLVGMSACAEEGDSFPIYGQCEFTTPSGRPVGVFTAVGVDLRTAMVSPPPNCPPLDDNGDD